MSTSSGQPALSLLAPHFPEQANSCFRYTTNKPLSIGADSHSGALQVNLRAARAHIIIIIRPPPKFSRPCTGPRWPLLFADSSFSRVCRRLEPHPCHAHRLSVLDTAVSCTGGPSRQCERMLCNWPSLGLRFPSRPGEIDWFLVTVHYITTAHRPDFATVPLFSSLPLV